MNKENQTTNSKDAFKGFALFNDIEDAELRDRNRAVVMANIAQDHSKNNLITPNGAGLILGYWKAIAEEERSGVMPRFVEQMKARGFHMVKQ